MPETQPNLNETVSCIEDTNLMEFKTDLRNVNWNLMNHLPETNLKHEKYPMRYTKNTFS